MPAWLLDSVALIDWFCGRTGVRPYFEEILEDRAQAAFSTVSEIELWQGMRPGEEAAHQAMFALLERVPLDGAIARRAGDLRRTFGLGQLSLPDAAIAATAELTGRTLVTRNSSDFEALKGTISVDFYVKN
jgi:predicted nucleic acid-binding protein